MVTMRFPSPSESSIITWEFRRLRIPIWLRLRTCAIRAM